MHRYHWAGQFACGVDGCQFDQIATYRADILNHQIATHTPVITCDFDHCGGTFYNRYHLQAHRRAHLNIKPFHCTWNGCGYASVQKGAAINHIRMVHFKLPKSKKQQLTLGIEDDRDPLIYLRVDTDQLEQAR